MKTHAWAVTGTFHGSIIYAPSEGEARRTFHRYYNGESIISMSVVTVPAYLSNENEYDEDEPDDFEPCENCDLPDACGDFGCAILQGLYKPILP